MISLIATAAGTIRAQDNAYQGMKGTETPVFHQSSETRKCYVFGEYVVKTNQPAGEGDDISVYKRSSSTSAKMACKTTGKAYLFIKDSDNNSFFGIAKSFLFVDSGTSGESRGLAVYDLPSRKSIINEGYAGEAKLVNGKFLIYDSISNKKGAIKTCKEAAKWKREGGGPIGWLQGNSLDLHTLKRTNVGTLRCIQME